MSDLKPFPIYRTIGTEVDFDRIKRVKISIPDLPKVAFAVATKYTGERILAWGTVPGASDRWLCDYALVTEATTDERLAEAIRWVLTDETHPKAVMVADILGSVFGPGVREIPPAELAAEQKVRDYLDGRE